MRCPILATLAPVALMLVGCTADISELRCAAATSYLTNEFSNVRDEEFVYRLSDDEITFDLSLLDEADRLKAISDFSETPWFYLDGTSVWEGDRFEEIAKTPEEIRMLRGLFDNPISENAVSKCPDVQVVLEGRGIAFGENPVEKVSAIKNPNLEKHAKTIASMYLPILSDDKQSAILLVERVWAPLAGVGVIVKIERQADGRWLPTRVQQVWVS